MIRSYRLLLFAFVLLISTQARAGVLDPFGHRAPTGARLDPFRRIAVDAKPVDAKPVTATPATAAGPQRCQQDEDCSGDNICEANVCQPIQLRTNIAYLYYREGTFSELLGLYWSRRGATGYRVVAPVYWHYWNPSSDALIVAPFYWRFEDRAQRTLVTWYGPVVSGHGPDWRSFAVLPIFYASSKFGWAAPLLGTLALKDPDAHQSLGVAAFLYWRWRSPTRSTDLGFPVFFSTRTPQSAFTFALPLNFYWRHDQDKRLLALPLFFYSSHPTGSRLITWLGYAHREGTTYGRSVAWLYWWGGNEKARSSYHVLFPLLWDFEGKKDRSTVVFPLVWSFRGPTWNTTVVAPFVHVRQRDWTFNAVPPLWWSTSDAKTGQARRVLVPLFYWDRAAHGVAAHLITPLGGYSRDDRAGTRTWIAVPLLSFGHRDGGGQRTMLTPLYWSHTDRAADSTTRLAGALFYRRTDPKGSTTTLFPLFWHFWDAQTGATATALLPLFAHRSGPRDTSTLVGPVYWRSFTHGGWSAGVLPILYFGRNAGRSHAVLFPLFWRFTSAHAATTLLFPLFFHHHDPSGSDTAVTPLFYTGDHGGESYTVLFPLLFHVASAQRQTSTTITPLGFSQHDADGTSVAIGPIVPLLYWRKGHDRSHFALVPLIWHFADRRADKTTTVVGPYWHRHWGGETTDGLFPLFAYRRGARPGGDDQTSLTLFPLFHYHRDATRRFFVTLLGATVRTPAGRGGFIGPYGWFHNANFDAHFVPFLYTDVLRRDNRQRLTQVGPWLRVEGPGYKAQALLPFFGHYADTQESETWVLPSYFRLRRRNGDKVDTLLPLFWRSSFGGRSTTIAGPYFAHRTPDGGSYGLVPLFFRAANKQRTMTIVPPLLLFQRSSTDGKSAWFSCLLYFHDRDPQGTVNALFPFYWSNVKKDRRTDIVFPIFWHFADQSTDSASTLVGPLYWSHTGRSRTRGLLPIAWYSHNDANGDASQAVMPLFYRSHGHDRSSFYTLFGGYHRSGPFHFWYAATLLHTDSPKASFSMLAPLFFSHTDKATDTTTTVIPPLLHVSRGNPETGLSSTLLLFWHYRDIATSIWLGAPLYYDSHAYRLSRTTLLLPIFLRHENEITQETTWLAPALLFFRHTTPTKSSTVWFPLVWDFKRGVDRTTVVFPFYVRARRADHIATWVFPTYYHRQGLGADGRPDGTYRRYIFPFYDSGVKRPGDFMWEVLGGLFGHERIGHHNFLRLFYFTIETEPTPPAVAAAAIQAPPPRRKAVPRGLQVAGW